MTSPPREKRSTTADVHAGERLLRSLKHRGVEYVFANFGTDHTPILEAAAHIRQTDPDAIPEFVVCPHEFAAMSAAHGYAAVTGAPQAVLVHVDVGTQNLGAAMHNAHRAGAPVFVLAGLAPSTDAGYAGSRDNTVHYAQDVFDQPGIVREYCRWVDEYRPPTDPDETVVRGLERAAADRPGPVYVSATREALETTIRPSHRRGPREVAPTGADAPTVDALTAEVAAADAPLVITGNPRSPAGAVETLVSFAERAGAGVVEHSPAALCFPRSHPLHAGYDPHAVFEYADLIVVAGTDVPWIPSKGTPPSDTPVIQVDADPTKSAYPHWSFRVDTTVTADPIETLAAVTDRLDATDAVGTATWAAASERRRAERAASLAEDRNTEELTPAVVSDALDAFLDERSVLVEGAVTSRQSLLDHVERDSPGSYVGRAGAGLGWAPGAAVGIKLAHPDRRVVAVVGDGSYVFANPTATAWMGTEANAPTLTVVYNNRGWQAVEAATAVQHPDGASLDAGVPESRFDTPLDLSVPAGAVGAHTRRVDRFDDLDAALRDAVAAVDDGTPAVVDVCID